MRNKGMFVKCDRCDAWVMVDALPSEIRDGGFTTYEKYEELPKGWIHEKVLCDGNANEPEVRIIDLCPVCALKFKQMNSAFLAEKPSGQMTFDLISERGNG